MTEIQIGWGKSARRAYSLDDVTIVSNRRTRDVNDVDLSWKIDAYKFDLPVVASGVDRRLTVDDVSAVQRSGALAMVDFEAMWTATPDVGAVKEAIAKAKGENGRIAASLSPKRAAELVEHALAAEVDLLAIRGGVVSAEHVSTSSDILNLKTFIRGLDVPVIVGGCASYNAALHLMRTGAAGVLVGVSRPELGIDVPLATALADARAARVRHLDETSVYCHLIAAGGIKNGVGVAKALAIGADAVLVDVDAVTASEGEHSIDQILRRSMAACGYTDVKAFQKAEVVVR
ncbi:MAG: IMP dehydrogenase [Acidimicrobiales bacterium]|nr:IMP dehydrogenase [Acidimicrobiales bacterium]MDG2216494.1 IMP dehydrogenase [Acidimicrobiales bacterium]